MPSQATNKTIKQYEGDKEKNEQINKLKKRFKSIFYHVIETS